MTLLKATVNRLFFRNLLKITPKNALPKCSNSSLVSSNFQRYMPLDNKIMGFISSNGPVSSTLTISSNDSSIKLPSLSQNLNKIVQIPTVTKTPIIENPFSHVIEKFDPLLPFVVEEPTQVVKKEAARLIVIRKRKMKKHKLRKLKKRMHFVWLKYNQKKEYNKEKMFQATQMAKIREAHAFDAAKYVKDIIARAKKVPEPPPKFSWRLRKDP